MISPEQLVVDAACDFLRRHLPAQVTSINASRFAVLKSASVSPFTIPADAVLRLSAVSPEATPTDVPLTAGVRTSAQVVADITAAAVPGITASEDIAGRVVLTATDAPAVAAPSVVVVARDVNGSNQPTGSNLAFGWSEGGEHVACPAIVAPAWRGVVDGGAITAPDMGGGFWVLLGSRTSSYDGPGIRKDTYNVTVQGQVWRPFGASAVQHRTREAISSCVRAVREVIASDALGGPYLGRNGDIQLARVVSATISDLPTQDPAAPGLMWDSAKFSLTCRVFQRPD